MISIWSDVKVKSLMPEVTVRRIIWSDFCIDLNFKNKVTIQFSKTILAPDHLQVFRPNPVKSVARLKSTWAQTWSIINQFITPLCHRRQIQLHRHHRAKIIISTQTILHMHTQIRTNLAKKSRYLVKASQKRAKFGRIGVKNRPKTGQKLPKNRPIPLF